MKSVMKRALALVIGLVITLATVEPSVAYAAPGHNHGSHSKTNHFTTSKHAHIYNRAVTDKWTDATCDRFATQVWACSQYVTKKGVKVLCDEEVTVITSIKLSHKYVSTATQESEGVYKCACGAVEYEMCYFCGSNRIFFGILHVPHLVKKVAPKLAHQHTVVTDAAVAATCTTDGLTEGSYCATCDEVFAAQEVVAATGHAWDEGYVWVEATCDKSGEVEYKCTNAGCDTTRTEYPVSNEHTWTTVAAVDSTCTEAGHNEYSMCDVCGIYWDYEEIPVTGHDVVVDEAVAATCTTTGLTEGSHCATCGEVLVAQEVVPVEEHAWYVVAEYTYCEIEGVRYYKCEAKCGANKEEVVAPLGHSYETVAAVAPTCTEDGNTEYTMCTTCGKYWDYEVLPATGHDVVVDEAVAATCTTTGLTEGSHCATCGEVLVAQEVVPVEEHAWYVVAEYTYCEIEGVRYYKCEAKCGANKEEVVAPLGHSYETVAAKDATCTEDGHTEYTMCTTCGKYWDYEVLPATGHDVVVDEAVAATCTTTGLTEGSHCATCGDVLVAQEVVPVEEHAWYVVKEYTYCEIECVRYYKCEAKCGANKEEVVAPLGHSYETVAAKDATCTEDGHTEYTMCTTCGKYWNYEVILAGHAWDVIWDVTPCQLPKGEVRERVSKCTVCKDRLIEKVESTGHTMEELENGAHCTTCNNFFPYL